MVREYLFHFPGGLDGLIEEADLIVEGRVVQSRSRPSSNSLYVETIHRFYVDEVIKGELPFRRGIPRSLPSLTRGLQPRSVDEIYLIRTGGAIVLNGVLFRESIRDFKNFRQVAPRRIAAVTEILLSLLSTDS